MSDNDNNVTDYFTSYIENNNIKRTKLGKLNNDVNEFASLLQSVNNSTLNKEDIIEVYPLDKDIQITDNNNKEEERKDVQVVLCDDDFGGTLNASYRNNEESILPERIELIRDDTINHNNKETTQREVSDQIKKIDYLIKKNNDQKTIKGLEIELNKEKRNQINNLNELNKRRKERIRKRS